MADDEWQTKTKMTDETGEQPTPWREQGRRTAHHWLFPIALSVSLFRLRFRQSFFVGHRPSAIGHSSSESILKVRQHPWPLGRHGHRVLEVGTGAAVLGLDGPAVVQGPHVLGPQRHHR